MKEQYRSNHAAMSNQSTDKAFSILEFLAQTGAPVRLLDLAQALDLNVSTAKRFLTSMIRCGYAAQDKSTGQYFLTYKICRIANQFSSRTDLQQITHSFLADVSNYFEESCCIAVEENLQTVYIDVATGQNKALLSQQRIGNTNAMHCTAIGKLLLKSFSNDMLEIFLQKRGLPPLTSKTITSKEQLIKEFAEIDRLGYAVDNEECELGMRCVACPILDYTGNVIAGICVTGPTVRLTMDVIAAKVSYLQETAAEISKHLGHEF